MSMIRFSSGEQCGFSCTCTFGIKRLLIIQKIYMDHWPNKIQLHYVFTHRMKWDVFVFAIMMFSSTARSFLINIRFYSTFSISWEDSTFYYLPNGANLFVLVPSWIIPLYITAQLQIHQTALFHLAARVPGCGAQCQSFALFQSAAPPPPYAAFTGHAALTSPPDSQAPGALLYDKTGQRKQ